MRLVALIFLFGFVILLRFFEADFLSDKSLLARTTMSAGFVLLVGSFFGHYTSLLKVPRITGYLIGGILCGPHIFNVIQTDEVKMLQFVDELALAMIAFTAGGEINVNRLRQGFKTIASITIGHLLIIPIATIGIFLLVQEHFGVFKNASDTTVLYMLVFLGIICACKSPATSVAVILETNAKGPVTDLVLGVTILKDILIIIVFSMCLSIVTAHHGGQTIDASATFVLLQEIGLSLLMGIVIGALPVFYLKYIQKDKVLFIFAFALFVILVSKVLHLEALLVAIIAGIIVENFSKRGDVFVKTVERASTPVFLVFFTIAGASLNLSSLEKYWPISVLYVVVRLVLTYGSTFVFGKVSGASAAVNHLSWMGFLGQAGVSLGFVALVQKAGILEDYLAAQFQSLVIGAIIINQIIGPILFKISLFKAGEINK